MMHPISVRFLKLIKIYMCVVVIIGSGILLFRSGRQVNHQVEQFGGISALPADVLNKTSFPARAKSKRRVVKLKLPEYQPVVLLGYQRSGSTFVNQLLNNNPSIYDVFEPLDAVYVDLYGTGEGWTVPADITTHTNGTLRHIPNLETNAMAEFLHNLFACNFDKLPTSYLIRKFWMQFPGDQTLSRPYGMCLRKYKAEMKLCTARTHVNLYCGPKFSAHPQERHNECHMYLNNRTSLLKKPTVKVKGKNTDVNFPDYQSCLSNARARIIDKCVPMFSKACKNSFIRAVKTVRGTMATMEKLLEMSPQTKIIHLIRDPRGVAQSRHAYDSSAQSRYARGNVVKEAEVYCRTVMADYKKGQRLEEEFPGSVYTLIYDSFVRDPLNELRKMYQFINATVHNKTSAWLKQHTRADAGSLADKWIDNFSMKDAKLATAVCKEFFHTIKYNWHNLDLL